MEKNKVQKSCTKCGTLIEKGILCKPCKIYIKNGGIYHTPSPYGEITHDINGKPICHICGKSFDKLIEHTKRVHGMGSTEYRLAFGLMMSARLTSPKYHKKMKDYVEITKSYEKNFSNRISIKETRSKIKIKQSAQEIQSRKEAQRKNGSQSKKNISPERMKELGIIWTKNLPNKKGDKNANV